MLIKKISLLCSIITVITMMSGCSEEESDGLDDISRVKNSSSSVVEIDSSTVLSESEPMDDEKPESVESVIDSEDEAESVSVSESESEPDSESENSEPLDEPASIDELRDSDKFYVVKDNFELVDNMGYYRYTCTIRNDYDVPIVLSFDYVYVNGSLNKRMLESGFKTGVTIEPHSENELKLDISFNNNTVIDPGSNMHPGDEVMISFTAKNMVTTTSSGLYSFTTTIPEDS